MLAREAKEIHQGRKHDSLKTDPCLKELTSNTVSGNKGYHLPKDLGKGIKRRSLETVSQLRNVFSNFNRQSSNSVQEIRNRAAQAFIHRENMSKTQKHLS